MKITGTVLAVTGAGNGMGREVTLQLVAKGARVAAIDISEAGLAETVALAGAHGSAISTHVVGFSALSRARRVSFSRSSSVIE